jgi:hypothetical protein
MNLWSLVETFPLTYEVTNLYTASWHYASRLSVRFMCESLFMIVSSRYQLSVPLAICSQLQLVSGVFHHGAVYFRVTCIFV